MGIVKTHAPGPDGKPLCGRKSLSFTTGKLPGCPVCRRYTKILAAHRPPDYDLRRSSEYRIRAKQLTGDELHDLWTLFQLGWRIDRIIRQVPGLTEAGLTHEWKNQGYPIRRYGGRMPSKLRLALKNDLIELKERVGMPALSAMAAAYQIARDLDDEAIEKLYREFLRRHQLIHPEWQPVRQLDRDTKGGF